MTLRFALAAVLLIAGVAACIAYEDHCQGVACGDGEVCLDLAAGPRCVCDDAHEDIEGSCVPLDDDGGTSG
jgi:hypothetical protein